MKIIAFWKPIMWWILILILSLMPAETISGQALFPHFDKLAHFGMYLILAILLWRPVFSRQPKSPMVLILITTISLGISVEFMQHWFTTDRYGSIGDVLANAGGSITGLVVWSRLPMNGRWLRWI